MDQYNTDGNSLRQKAVNAAGLGGRNRGELEKFSSKGAVFTEQSCAAPDYSKWIRTLTGTPPGDANDPNTTAPTTLTGLWNLLGYWGLHCYVAFTGGTSPTCTLQLWGWDNTADNYYLIEEVQTVFGNQEVHFDGKVRGRTVFIRVTGVTAGVTALSVRACPE